MWSEHAMEGNGCFILQLSCEVMVLLHYAMTRPIALQFIDAEVAERLHVNIAMTKICCTSRN